MNESKYKVIGRVKSGTKVLYYVLLDTTDNSKKLFEKSEVEQLALDKKIENCRAQVYNNIVNIKGIDCKLNKLPHYDENCNIIEDDNANKLDKYLLVGKTVEGKKIINYVLYSYKDDCNIIVPKDDILEFSTEHKITNVKVQTYKNQCILRGKRCSLNNIAVYKNTEVNDE